jgi:hypothetical protein
LSDLLLVPDAIGVITSAESSRTNFFSATIWFIPEKIASDDCFPLPITVCTRKIRINEAAAFRGSKRNRIRNNGISGSAKILILWNDQELLSLTFRASDKLFGQIRIANVFKS